MRSLRLAAAAATTLALVATGAPSGTAAVTPGATPQAVPADDRARSGPSLRVRTVVGDVDVPWDLTFLPKGAMLYTQRDRERISYRGPGGVRKIVADTPDGVWHEGETGMMSILAARNFKQSRAFYTCYGGYSNGNRDIRVVKWKLNRKSNDARRVKVIVKNLPTTSGRHGGCRLRFGSEGALYVGTGDATIGTSPQNLKSGGGKVLRVKPKNGRGLKSNPFAGSDNPMKRRVFTYGHRNVQGLALRKDGRMWSVEHGTYRDDEVNLLRKGGNYGWDPGPEYDESTPMTDHSLPGKQINARWSSGSPTIATSGGTWITGKRWGRWQGCLAVAALKDSSLRIMKFGPGGHFKRMWTPPALNGDFGRLRSVVMGPHNAMYVTTSNGGGGAGGDRILRVTPRS
ncbi:MAG: PQQ-dependent sugar dehydrogenase [Nocardioidaceae bacterium]